MHSRRQAISYAAYDACCLLYAIFSIEFSRYFFSDATRLPLRCHAITMLMAAREADATSKSQQQAILCFYFHRGTASSSTERGSTAFSSFKRKHTGHFIVRL